MTLDTNRQAQEVTRPCLVQGRRCPRTLTVWSKDRRATTARVPHQGNSDSGITRLPLDFETLVPILGVRVKHVHFSWILEALAIRSPGYSRMTQSGQSSRGEGRQCPQKVILGFLLIRPADAQDSLNSIRINNFNTLRGFPPVTEV